MKLSKIASIKRGQDGAIHDGLLFRFDIKGVGSVYDLSKQNTEAIDLPPIAEFTLDGADIVVPHSNAVVFSAEYFEEGDEFPILFSNVYNNYAKEDDKKVGVAAAYRIWKEGERFLSKLLGTVEIGFTSDRELWRSAGETADVRPYGNFVIDKDASKYYAFVMRDGERKTRFFRFSLPNIKNATPNGDGLRRIILEKEAIEDYFDTPYHNYMQGAVCHGGKIYSVEGFHEKIHPAIRIIDLAKKEEETFFDFFEAGFIHEPELIDFLDEKCIYSDAVGNLFHLEI